MKFGHTHVNAETSVLWKVLESVSFENFPKSDAFMHAFFEDKIKIVVFIFSLNLMTYPPKVFSTCKFNNVNIYPW